MIRLFVLFFVSLSYCLFADESIHIDSKYPVQVLSDKAFRKTGDNRFEAIGNVVIKQNSLDIYGEKASLDMAKGSIEIEGNVRFLSDNLKIYGSKLEYNYLNKKTEIDNARLSNGQFILVGKKIKRVDDKTILATDAEYTTCRDCPESWSIFGRDVRIEMGEYVYIKNAYFKINGVIVTYIPYIVFPIKKDRQTGLLFPKLKFSFSDEGVIYEQPWFWAINDRSDATISPFIWGSRGAGTELEYRHELGEKKSFLYSGIFNQDKVYQPFKIDKSNSGSHYLREFNHAELNFGHGYQFNQYYIFNQSSDLDFSHDFVTPTNDKIFGPYIVSSAMADYTNSYATVSIDARNGQNLLYKNPVEFDRSYVQVLPRVNFSLTPINLTPRFFHGNESLERFKLLTGGSFEFSRFRQNDRLTQLSYIRNADRYNFTPFLQLDLGHIGPVKLTTKAILDAQYYRLLPGSSAVDKNTHFTKQGVIYKSGAEFEVFKVFGQSTVQETSKLISTSRETNLLGELPSVAEEKSKNEHQYLLSSSYKHSQLFGVSHYYLSDQKVSGNPDFGNQINSNTGTFDYQDTIRAKSHEYYESSSQTDIPLNNTVEFTWKNSLVKKTPIISNQEILNSRTEVTKYSLNEVAHFNVSQGYDLHFAKEYPDSNLLYRLTRLYIDSAWNYNDSTISLNEYYFYIKKAHKLDLTIDQKLTSFLSAAFGYSLDSLASQTVESMKYGIKFFPLSILEIDFNGTRDIAKKKTVDNLVELKYAPVNNCWKLGISYLKNQIETAVAFNFQINYSDRFVGVGGQK